MKIAKGVTIGMIFGLVLSFLVSFMFMFIAQSVSGGITSLWGERWLYNATIVPFMLAFAFLGYFFMEKLTVSKKQFWVLSSIIAFFITVYSGTIGAILGEYLVRGELESLNVEGTLVWGTIYAFVLLPLTTPFTFLIIKCFHQWITKFK